MPVTISGSGTITGIATGGLPDGSIASSDLADNAVTAGKLASSLDLTGKTVTLPSGTGGKILQVQSTSKLDAFTGSSTSFADITGMTVSITPTAADSNILIDANFVVSNTAGGRSMYFNLVRGSTAIAQPSAGNPHDSTIQCNTISFNYNVQVAKIQFLDDPTYTLGDTITYKIQYKTDSGTVAIGRRGDRADELSISTITAMEVAA